MTTTNTIINPGPMDILSGRGSGATQHAGNQDYLCVINMNKAAAKSMSVKEKKKLVKKLHSWFCSSGYRFLKQTRKTGNRVEYTELRPVQAKDKIRQALNDKPRATVFPTHFRTIAPANPRSTFWSDHRAHWPRMHPNIGSESPRHGTGSYGYENGDGNLNRTLPLPSERPQDLPEPTPLGSLLNDTHADKTTSTADRLDDDNDSIESVDDDQILPKFQSLLEDLLGATECREFIAEIGLMPQDEDEFDLW